MVQFFLMTKEKIMRIWAAVIRFTCIKKQENKSHFGTKSKIHWQSFFNHTGSGEFLLPTDEIQGFSLQNDVNKCRGS